MLRLPFATPVVHEHWPPAIDGTDVPAWKRGSGEASMKRNAGPVDGYDVRRNLLARVAWLYYVEQLNQQEIADRLRISRVKVTRLLQRARDESVVEVRIADENAPCLDIEQRLVKHFGLRDAVVIPTDDSERLRQYLGYAAADYLEQILQQGDVIGVGSGATLSQIPAAITRGAKPRCSIVELIGGLSQTDRTVNPYDCSWRLADALGAKSEHLLVPAVAESAGARDVLLSDGATRTVLDRAARCDIALVGIGQLYSSTRAGMEYVPARAIEGLHASGAVGDILLRFVDTSGMPIRSEFDDCIVGLTLPQLQDVPLVVGVAGGPAKVPAIAGALSGGLVDVIICDQAAALVVLEQAGADAESLADPHGWQRRRGQPRSSSASMDIHAINT
jgi:DNA-binding transcriptional regulator LsrR (DeoR family)